MENQKRTVGSSMHVYLRSDLFTKYRTKIDFSALIRTTINRLCKSRHISAPEATCLKPRITKEIIILIGTSQVPYQDDLH